MKIYFGQADYADGDLFEHSDGNFFYQLDYLGSEGYPEDFMLTDTCGRGMPLPVNSIDALIEGLLIIKSAYQAYEHAEHILANITNDYTIIALKD